MYLSIIIFPLLGSIFSGFLGRKIGIKGSQLISCSCLFLSAIISTFAFYEVGLCSSPVSINIGTWIDSEVMLVPWSFLFDQLSVVFCIMITYITFLILVYTVYYMEGQPHVQRFFSYLSAFAGFMLILVTGGNYFVLFVGWEGILQCLKSIVLKNSNIGPVSPPTIKVGGLVDFLNIKVLIAVLPGIGPIKLNSLKRIGPHNIDILSLIIGSTLGDSHLEKRAGGIGTRVIFEQSNKNVEYLMWFHKILSLSGYCNPKKPKLFKRIKKKNEVFFHSRFNSYTFYSFNWIHEMFYSETFTNPNAYTVTNNPIPAAAAAAAAKGEGWSAKQGQGEGSQGNAERVKYRKIIPYNISDFLTPLALAIWFMDDGSKINNTVRIATNCFTYEEVEFLSAVLLKNFNLISKPQKSGKDKAHILYFSSSSMVQFSKIVKPYMLPSMFYKLAGLRPDIKL
jgi:hypothetical protein